MTTTLLLRERYGDRPGRVLYSGTGDDTGPGLAKLALAAQLEAHLYCGVTVMARQGEIVAWRDGMSRSLPVTIEPSGQDVFDVAVDCYRGML